MHQINERKGIRIKVYFWYFFLKISMNKEKMETNRAHGDKSRASRLNFR